MNYKKLYLFFHLDFNINFKQYHMNSDQITVINFVINI